MKRFVLGFITGAICSVVITATAAVEVIKANSFLIGWEVTKDGDTICYDPFVWIAGSIKEIDCG